MTDVKDKIKGAVYGFIIGDAMGATVEFMTEGEIGMRYGQLRTIKGGGWLNLKPGEVTDDTQMTLCVMDALMKSTDPSDFGKYCVENFIDWFDSKPKDVGGACARAIKGMKAGIIGNTDEEARGNGALMRAMPCALIMRTDLNVIQSNLTHNTAKEVIEYHDILSGLIYGKELKLFLPELSEPTGYVVNTWGNALYHLLHAESFGGGMIKAVNHGGDADTIAAITGSLLGARFGYDGIPQTWIKKLDKKATRHADRFLEWVFDKMQL